jgi:hypothetical protein
MSKNKVNKNQKEYCTIHVEIPKILNIHIIFKNKKLEYLHDLISRFINLRYSRMHNIDIIYILTDEMKITAQK